MQKTESQSTLTTKDLYRKAVIDQFELINRQKAAIFPGENPQEIAYGVLGVYWSVAGLKNMLSAYINEEMDEKGNLVSNPDYKKGFDNIDLNFSLLYGNPTMSNIRKFMGALNKWMDLLTYYFADAGILPKKRVKASLATREILKIDTLEQLQDAVRKLLPEQRSREIVEIINEEVREIGAIHEPAEPAL